MQVRVNSIFQHLVEFPIGSVHGSTVTSPHRDHLSVHCAYLVVAPLPRASGCRGKCSRVLATLFHLAQRLPWPPPAHPIQEDPTLPHLALRAACMPLLQHTPALSRSCSPIGGTAMLQGVAALAINCLARDAAWQVACLRTCMFHVYVWVYWGGGRGQCGGFHEMETLAPAFSSKSLNFAASSLVSPALTNLGAPAQ